MQLTVKDHMGGGGGGGAGGGGGGGGGGALCILYGALMNTKKL